MIQSNCLRQVKKIAFSLIPTLAISVLMLSLLSDTTYATTSENIVLQGKIVRNDTGYEGLNVVNGTPSCVQSGTDSCDFRVRYYNDPDLGEGDLYLTETFSNKEIGDYAGVFNLTLGTGTVTTTSECSDGTCNTVSEVINNFDDIYLEIGFDPAGGGSFTETFTRTALGASAYAIKSQYAKGSVEDSFDFHTAANSTGITTTTGSVYYNTTDNELKVYNGSGWTSLGSAGSTAWQSEDVSGWTHSAYIGGNIATLANFSLDIDDDRLSINADQPEGGLSVYSSNSAGSNWPLVSFKADSSSFDAAVLQLTQDGTGNIIEGYSGSTLGFQVDSYGDVHLANNGIGYIEPFASEPTSGSLNPNSGEGCFYSYGGDLYWDSACDGTAEEQLNGATGSTLWTDGGTFTYLASTTDDLVLGSTTTAGSAFFFDVSEGRLGIGTDTPSADIDIAGSSSEISNTVGDITISPTDTFVVKDADTDTENLMEWQNSSGTVLSSVNSSGHFGIGTTPSATKRLDALLNVSDPTATVTTASYRTYSNAATANNATSTYGTTSDLYVIGGYNHTGAQIAYIATAYNNGTGNVSYLEGFRGGVGNLTTGTVTNAYGVRSYVYSPGSGTIDNLYGFETSYYAATATNMYGVFTNANTAATGTNKYGLYISNVSGASSGNYAIYTGTGLNRFGDDVNISGTLTLTGDFATGTNNTYDIGTSAARLKDAYYQGTTYIGANGDSGGIRYNTTDNELEFSNDGSTWIPMADASKTVTLSAEYAGAVLTADGTSNTGAMTSDAESNHLQDNMNFYEWNSSETSLNDYDIRLRFTIPDDFDSWATTAMTFNYLTEATGTTNNKIDFYVYEEGASSADAFDTDNASATADTWTTATIAGSSLTDCNAVGETCMLIFRMYSANDSYTRVGDIDITYNRKL